MNDLGGFLLKKKVTEIATKTFKGADRSAELKRMIE